MNAPEQEPKLVIELELFEADELDGTFIPQRAIPEDELSVDMGMRGGIDRRIFEVNSELYGHKGYGEVKGWND